MAKTRTRSIATSNGTSRAGNAISSLAVKAKEVRQTLKGLNNGVLLTESDVDESAEFVQLIVNQQDLLNRIVGELNKLPSEWKAEYSKADPNPHRY